MSPHSSIRGILAGLSLSVLLSSLGTSIANVGLPTLVQAFGASFQQVQWVILAYLLAITSLIVGIGRLGDLIGRRRLLLAGIAVFTLASGLCAIAPTLALLIAARAIQGVGAAVMMALTMAIVGDAIPKEKTGSTMGLLATMSASGTALGPSLGGVLIAAWGWKAIFSINLPLGMIAFGLAYRYLPADRRPSNADHPSFDIWGMVLLSLTLAAYALAMTVGGDLDLIFLAMTAIGLGLFFWLESRTQSPLIRVAMFRQSGLRGSLLSSALVATIVMATLVVGPFYLTKTLGQGAVIVGLTMSVGPLVAALTGIPAGRMVDCFGTYPVTLGGLGAMVLGALGLAVTPLSVGLAGYIVPLAVLTAGYALFQTANNTAVMTHVSDQGRGLVSALLNLSRNLGLITGASAMGAVFALAWSGSDVAQATAQAVATGMRTTFLVAACVAAAALAITILGRKKPGHEMEPAA
ncbi:MFS transporter [Magnetospirillum sp. J10]|uniref:MFS transporter n=2 Tax=Magnetospirillum sulfuroxidans TaxID=611300 RepID=A0ABS5I7F0_9PROT|nr:MFS transporter [Magnetospirillum sulfuroxidans]